MQAFVGLKSKRVHNVVTGTQLFVGTVISSCSLTSIPQLTFYKTNTVMFLKICSLDFNTLINITLIAFTLDN
jgi:hypothetical protein